MKERVRKAIAEAKKEEKKKILSKEGILKEDREFMKDGKKLSKLLSKIK